MFQPSSDLTSFVVRHVVQCMRVYVQPIHVVNVWHYKTQSPYSHVCQNERICVPVVPFESTQQIYVDRCARDEWTLNESFYVRRHPVEVSCMKLFTDDIVYKQSLV